MRFVELSTSTTVALELEQRADATPTFEVLNPSGGVTLSSTAVTLDSVNTTLSGAAAAGATTVSVASASSIVRGRKYLLTAAEALGGEFVTAKAVSGTTITLVRPLQIAHASGAAFASARLTCAVTGAAVGATGRGYRIRIFYKVATVTQPYAVFPFDVVRTAPVTFLRADDIADLDPVFAKRRAAGVWFPALADASWQMLLEKIAVKIAPGAVLRTRDMTIPHGYHVRMLALENAGPEYKEARELMGARFQQEFDAALAAGPVDDDQDGAVESHEGWKPRTISLQRG